MTKNPEIEIRRGLGWSRKQWETWEPHLQRATRQAQRGLGYLGIRYTEPKQGTVRRYADRRAMTDDGLAFDAIRFQLNVTIPQPGIRPRLVQRVAHWSGVVVHEVIHCARMEELEGFHIVEKIATEGLGYLGERMYLQKFYPSMAGRLLDYDLFADRALEHSFREAYANVGQRHAWFNARTRITDLPDGALFGVQCVQQRLNEGRNFADLVYAPADEIIGL